MASTRPKTNRQGEVTGYEIRVDRGRDEFGDRRKPYVMTWPVPQGWSQRSIQAELKNIVSQFRQDCKVGLILTKEEKRERAERQQKEEQQRFTFERYALEIFMPRKEATFSENSRDNYTRYLRQSFKYLGILKMSDIRPIDVTNFFIALQTKEKVMRMSKGGLIATDKPLYYSTVIKYYTILHSLFKMAYMDDVIPMNVMDKVERPKPRKDDVNQEVKAYTVEEARYILQCIEEEPFQWQVIMRIYLDIGCRRGELLGLRWQSVDFEHGTITIENKLQYSASKGVYCTTPKGKKRRTIDVDPAIMVLMRRLKSSQIIKSLENYCFTQEDGQPLHPQTPTRYMKLFGERYGIHNLHPHALRHTAASIAVIHGADIAIVSKKLGHADISTILDMYVESNDEAVRKANEVYRNALYEREA